MINQDKPIFLDFDGVICDSNLLKKQNILTAASQVINEDEAKRFTDFFTSKNGVPREKKTFEYFEAPKVAKEILAIYEDLNNNLNLAEITHGLIDFLLKYKESKLSILSGGSKREIIRYLIKNKIYYFFTDILCGPKTKEENLKILLLKYPAIFIGDSFHDYEVAVKFRFDFIFMYGATQEINWERKNFQNTLITKNFKTLLEDL